MKFIDKKIPSHELFYEQISTREFTFEKEHTQCIVHVHTKIHRIIQKESSFELFHEILLKKRRGEDSSLSSYSEMIPSHLLIIRKFYS